MFRHSSGSSPASATGGSAAGAGRHPFASLLDVASLGATSKAVGGGAEEGEARGGRGGMGMGKTVRRSSSKCAFRSVFRSFWCYLSSFLSFPPPLFRLERPSRARALIPSASMVGSGQAKLLLTR